MLTCCAAHTARATGQRTTSAAHSFRDDSVRQRVSHLLVPSSRVRVCTTVSPFHIQSLACPTGGFSSVPTNVAGLQYLQLRLNVHCLAERAY